MIVSFGLFFFIFFFFFFLPSFTCIIQKGTILKCSIYKLIQDKFKNKYYCQVDSTCLTLYQALVDKRNVKIWVLFSRAFLSYSFQYQFPIPAALSQSPKLGFPNSNATGILGQVIFCCRDCPRHWRIFSTTVPSSLNVSSNPPIVTTKNVSRQTNILQRAKSPPVENTDLTPPSS